MPCRVFRILSDIAWVDEIPDAVFCGVCRASIGILWNPGCFCVTGQLFFSVITLIGAACRLDRIRDSFIYNGPIFLGSGVVSATKGRTRPSIAWSHGEVGVIVVLTDLCVIFCTA